MTKQIIQNLVDPDPALAVHQLPGSFAKGNPALAVYQADSTGPGVLIHGAGSMIDMQTIPGVSKFSVDNSGNVTAAGTVTAGAAVLPGAYLRAPNVYNPGGGASPAVSSSTLAAFDSTNINTGSFTAPASGTVVVGASFCLQPPSTTIVAFALAAHGTVSPVVGNVVTMEVSSTNVQPAQVLQFVVSGLTPAASYNFDLLGASANAVAITIKALGSTSTTPTGTFGGPVVMTVQAV